MYFGGRALTEVVAAHLFVISIYLAEPGTRVEGRWRLFFAGVFAGATLMFRIHLAPAVGLLWIWRGLDRRRIVFLSLGAMLAVALNGVFDAVTWQYPFEPLWRNIQFNLLQHGSDYFGVEPWWKYFYWMGANWGGTIALFFPLAFLGGRRAPFLVVSAFTILLVHSAIGHKEYRFVYPAILLLSIAMGLGAVEAARLLTHGWRDGARNPAKPVIVGVLAVWWALLVHVNNIGRDYQKHWNRAHASTQAALYVSTMHNVCGIGLNRVGNYETGGYTYFHKRVPLYWQNLDSWKVMAEAPAFNVMLYSASGASPARSCRAIRPIAPSRASRISACCAVPAAAAKSPWPDRPSARWAWPQLPAIPTWPAWTQRRLRHRLLQILVDLVEEAFGGQPFLVGADQQRQILGHEAALDRVDADLLQRVRRTWPSAGIVVELGAMGEARASRRRSRRWSWSRSPCPSDARGNGASPCRARLRLPPSCRRASSAPTSSGPASRSPAPPCRTARRRRNSCRPRHSRRSISAREATMSSIRRCS